MHADPALTRVSLARATLGGFAAFPGTTGRALVAVCAVALGVALGFAVQLINHTAVSEFNAAFATLSGDADLQVQGGRSGFPEELYPRLARDAAVAASRGYSSSGNPERPPCTCRSASPERDRKSTRLNSSHSH